MNSTNQIKEKQTVLIVDDQKEVLRFMEIGLKHHGFEVITATSGKEALDVIRSQKPHIMLLDIIMPVMNGLEVLRKLRTFSSMPVIAFSATPENHDDALSSGADDSTSALVENTSVTRTAAPKIFIIFFLFIIF